jgi:hypothetical protein
MKKNKKLFTEATEEVIKETWGGGGGSVFGGASGGGAGSFSYTSKAAGKQSLSGGKGRGAASPPFRGATGTEVGFNIKDIAEESEAFAKSGGKNKPFPLEQVNTHLVDAYISLSNAEVQLHSCCKYNKIFTTHKEKKAMLEHCYRKVKALKMMIQSVSKDFDRVTLS